MSQLKAVEPEEEAAVVDSRVESSGWRDPRLYVGILSVLLTIFLWLANRVSGQLETISVSVQAIAVSNATQATKLDALKDRVAQLEAAVPANEHTQRDYNYNLSTRLGKVETAIELTKKGK